MGLLPKTFPEWEAIRAKAKELNADGCTGVSELYRECCLLHDVYYRLGKDLEGHTVTRAEADRALRLCIQSRSPFGKFSPISWVRWAGTRVFGGLVQKKVK